MSDLIRRQDAIYAIIDELMPSTPLSVVIRAKNRFKDLPAAQPERKQGKWIQDGSGGNQYDAYYIYMCSCCKKRKAEPKTNFCPNCGADMRGET